MIEINGMAHVVLNVTNWKDCKIFYEKVMVYLGLKKVFSGKNFLYFVGGRTALAINTCGKEIGNQRFDQKKVGLHHLCFRAKTKKDIDIFYKYLNSIKAKIVHGPEIGSWAPGYYSVLFEDPIGTRLELNFVPGKGVLKEGKSFNPSGDYN